MLPDIVGLLFMFVLRIGIPLAAIMTLSWLAYRWLGEEKTVVRSADKRQEVAPRASIGGPAPLAHVMYFETPCWDIKGCTEQAKAVCPAHARPELPCWLASQMKTGHMKDKCFNCDIYERPVVRA
jgi:hypothetical protein